MNNQLQVSPAPRRRLQKIFHCKHSLNKKRRNTLIQTSPAGLSLKKTTDQTGMAQMRFHGIVFEIDLKNRLCNCQQHLIIIQLNSDSMEHVAIKTVTQLKIQEWQRPLKTCSKIVHTKVKSHIQTGRQKILIQITHMDTVVNSSEPNCTHTQANP